MRYRNKGFSRKPKSKLSLPAMLLAFVFLAAIGMISLLLFNSDYSLGTFGLDNSKENLVEAWHEERYNLVYDRSREVLKNNPLDGDYLVLNGYAAFYSGINHPDSGEQHDRFQSAVKSLRTALLVTPETHHPEIHYVLGKAYFHLGRFYSDSAYNTLVLADDLGFSAPDLYDYIGLAGSQLERYEEAIAWLSSALENRSSPILTLNLAEILFKNGDHQASAGYAEELIDNTDDEQLITEAELLIGRAALEQGLYGTAEDHFLAMIESGRGTADARYWLGEVYYQMDDSIQARAEWREAIRQNPDHSLAAERLQGR